MNGNHPENLPDPIVVAMGRRCLVGTWSYQEGTDKFPPKYWLGLSIGGTEGEVRISGPSVRAVRAVLHEFVTRICDSVRSVATPDSAQS